jgi:uncharacterized pyridoxamine 5'-phosphate oxidase family protein
MTKSEIFAFLNANPVCFLATVDGDQPRVRGMMLFSAGDEGILFHTGEGKEMTEQMRRNPAVEMCTFDQQSGIQVRVRGTVEFVEEIAVKQRVIADRPFLQPIVDQIGIDAFLVFRITKAAATVWTMEANLAPKTFVEL